jgi:hypothetical protein
MVRARRRISARSWLSLAVDALNYRYINNGGLASSSFSFGPPTIGYYRTAAASPTALAALYARALLPLDTARQNGVETGLEIGGTMRALLAPRALLDGGLALTAPIDIVGGESHARLEPILLGEAWYAFSPVLAGFAGATLRAQISPDPAFISAAPRLGGRWLFRRRFWTAALVEIPVVGRDRTDLIASLFAGFAP